MKIAISILPKHLAPFPGLSTRCTVINHSAAARLLQEKASR